MKRGLVSSHAQNDARWYELCTSGLLLVRTFQDYSHWIALVCSCFFEALKSTLIFFCDCGGDPSLSLPSPPVACGNIKNKVVRVSAVKNVWYAAVYVRWC